MEIICVAISIVLIALFLISCKFASDGMKIEVDSRLHKPWLAGDWTDWSHAEWNAWVLAQYKAGCVREISAKMNKFAAKMTGK